MNSSSQASLSPSRCGADILLEIAPSQLVCLIFTTVLSILGLLNFSSVMKMSPVH